MAISCLVALIPIVYLKDLEFKKYFDGGTIMNNNDDDEIVVVVAAPTVNTTNTTHQNARSS